MVHTYTILRQRLIIILPIICSIMVFFTGCSRNLSEDTDKIADLDASVVKLECFDMWGQLIATGSGFIAIDGQTIFTNYHVIDEAYSVELTTNKNIKFSVPYIIAESEECDVAVLRTELETNLKPLNFGNTSKLEKGEKVVAIGSPKGLQNMVSIGNYGGSTFVDDNERIQFTAPISSGSSGGALFNEKAELIGITYASYDEGQNLNFAIRAEDVMMVYENSKNGTIEISKFCSDHYAYVAVAEAWKKNNGELPPLLSQSELQNNPQKYDDQYVTLFGYISSVHKGVFTTYAYLTSDTAYISDDFDTDDMYFNKLSFQQSPYIQLAKIVREPSEDLLGDVKYGDYVMAIGSFNFSTAAEIYAETVGPKDVRLTDLGFLYLYEFTVIE